MGKSRLETLLNEGEHVDLILSYSKLLEFDRVGAKALVEKTTPDNLNALKMGALVDDLLFSKDSFSEKYLVSDYNMPTATLGTLSKIVSDNYTEMPSIEEIFKIIEKNKLWSSTKNLELLAEKFDTEEFWGYLEDKFKSANKIVISSDEKMRADEIVEVLLNHEFSKSIFGSDMDHVYQYKFNIVIGKFKVRGILDIISIDHKNKKVYFKDLKTGSAESSEFLSSYIKWRYYLQEAIYCLAFEEICKTLGLVGYELQPFEFLYIGLKEKIPVSYVVPSKWHDAALKGFKTSGGYRYKGLYELIDEVYFHWKNKIYDLSKEIYDNKGKISLNCDFINLI